MAIVNLEATDVFLLEAKSAKFNVQRSSIEHTEESKTIKDSAGNYECETQVQGTDNYSAEYAYCAGESPDIATDLGSFLSGFGGLENAIIITGMTVNFNAGEYATVQIDGIVYDDNHPTVAIGVADFSSTIPAGAGFGVPLVDGTTLGTVASGASVTVTCTCDLKSAIGSDGNNFANAHISFESSCTAEYVGLPSVYKSDPGALLGIWTTDSHAVSDENEEFDSTSWAGHFYQDLT